MIFKNVLISRNFKYIRSKSNWIQPEGYDTTIKVYNCIAKEKVPFVVRNKNYVTWYTCGPTVYDSAHIGHASCYVKLDIIQRILRKYFKLNIVSVMNITDIDDKIINRSTTLSIPHSEISKKYEKEFWDDLKLLNIKKPDVILRVTDYIPMIQQFIQKLLNENKAYITDDGSVYFELNKYKMYGKLQNIGMVESKDSKKSAGDFALWKGVKPGEPSWDSKWGAGRPGWHIECSAMASGIFGNNIDVHAGGIDLRFPHHENEEAQSCSYFNTKQWVNYWFHTGHLHLSNDQKMSKSLKNTVSIQELQEQIDLDVFRMACFMSHYRANMEFSLDILTTAETFLKKIKTFLNDCESYINGYLLPANLNETKILNLITQTNNQMIDAFKDDFNTAKMIKLLLELITTINKMLHIPNSEASNLKNCGVIIITSNFVREQMNILGFKKLKKDIGVSIQNIDFVMEVLNSFRQNVRNHALENKNTDLLKYCDNVRTELRQCKINVQDFGKVSSWNKL